MEQNKKRGLKVQIQEIKTKIVPFKETSEFTKLSGELKNKIKRD